MKITRKRLFTVTLLCVATIFGLNAQIVDAEQLFEVVPSNTSKQTIFDKPQSFNNGYGQLFDNGIVFRGFGSGGEDDFEEGGSDNNDNNANDPYEIPIEDISITFTILILLYVIRGIYYRHCQRAKEQNLVCK